MPRVEKNKIIFDESDFLAGLHPQYATGSTNVPVPRGEKGLAFSLNIDPFRSLGNIVPGALATDMTNVSVINTAIRDVATGVESSTQFAYCLSEGTKLHQLNISTKTLTNAGAWPHVISATAGGLNIVAYNSNVASASTPSVFYTWNDSGGTWNMGRYIPSSATFQDTYYTATAATPITPAGNTKPHPVCVGANGILYIGDGNVLQGLDGTTGAEGTAISANLTLPAGFLITSIKKVQIAGTPFLALFAYYSPQGSTVTANFESSGPAICYFWDYLSLNPTYVYPLNDSAVSAGFEFQGTIGCFTAGPVLGQEIGAPSRFTRLQIFQGNGFKIIENIIGNPPIEGGVDIVGESIQWNSDGSIHSYGSPIPGFKAGHNILSSGATVGLQGGTNCRILRTIGGDIGYQIISTGATTSGGLQYMSNNFVASGSFSTQEGIPIGPAGSMFIATSVKIAFAENCSGGRALDFYLKDQSGNTVQVISTLQTVTATNIIREYYEDQARNDLNMRFEALSIIGSYSAGTLTTIAPFIKQVEVTFDTVNIEST